MQAFILILKGFIIGIGKIIPGVSGSLLAFSLGVYEKAITYITEPFKNIQETIYFLFNLGLGIILAIIFFSRIVLSLLKHFPLCTTTLFLGLICGTIPYIFKRFKIRNSKNILTFLIPIVLITFINNYNSFEVFIPSADFSTYLHVILFGFLDAATMIIPGISGTATFMMLKCYNFILALFANPFAHLAYTICFGLGVIIGIIIVSKFIAFMLKKHSNLLYSLVLGFTLSSVMLLLLPIIKSLCLSNIIYLIPLYIIGFFISLKLGNL